MRCSRGRRPSCWRGKRRVTSTRCTCGPSSWSRSPSTTSRRARSILAAWRCASPAWCATGPTSTPTSPIRSRRCCAPATRALRDAVRARRHVDAAAGAAVAPRPEVSPRAVAHATAGSAFCRRGSRTSRSRRGAPMKPTISRCVSAAAVALLAVATACSDARDPLSPKLQAWNQPPPPQSGELKGTGTIPDPEGGLITFTFDVTHDATGTHGSFFASAAPGGLPETLTASSFTSFTFGSSFCATPGNGDEFGAAGTLVEGINSFSVTFTVKACDNGPALVGGDTFSLDIPSRTFHAEGTVVGDIQKL